MPISIGESKTTEEKVDQISNYLYMLIEQLRYSMANFGRENFNQNEFESIAKIITEPVYLQLEDENRKISSCLEATAGELTLKIEGISDLVDQTGKSITSISAGLDAISTRMSTAEGNYSKLLQSVGEISSTVGSYDQSISKIRQSVESISLEVTNLGGSSVISLARDGVLVQSQTITLTGVVRFEDLMGIGTTAINGSNITTGTIKGVTYYAAGLGESFVVTDHSYSHAVGGIRYDFVDADGLYADKMYLYTSTYFDGYSIWYPSVKIESVGNISVEAPGGLIYMKAGQYVTIDCADKFTVYATHYVNYSPVVTTWEFAGGALYKNGVAVL